MPEGNAEIVRAAYEAVNRGDMRSFLSSLDRDVIWRGAGHGTDPDTYTGHEGVDRYYRTRLDVWEELRQEPEELLEAGHCIVAVVRTKTRGKASGIALEERSAHLWELRDGKVVRFEAHEEVDEALAAAGEDPPERA